MHKIIPKDKLPTVAEVLATATKIEVHPMSPHKKHTCALLDKDGIFHTMHETDTHSLTDQHLPEITECDLPPGRYRWDPKAETFWPLRPPEPEKAMTPNVMKAIMHGFKAIQASGAVDLPPETKDWMHWFENSIDNRDNVG